MYSIMFVMSHIIIIMHFIQKATGEGSQVGGGFQQQHQQPGEHQGYDISVMDQQGAHA